MQPYKKQFIRLAIDYQVLRFGEFTLKSGRVSPYFFNAGLFNSGQALARLGAAYAQAVIDYELEFDVLFGPAYKGIPLVSALAIALSRHHDIDKPYAFNRKEAKDHGEGGAIVGAPVRGRVLVVDDVITAGTAIRESFEMISAHKATVSAVLIALDRQERGRGEHSAIQEIEKEFGISVYSIITLDDLIEYLADDKQLLSHLDAMCAYRNKYGV